MVTITTMTDGLALTRLLSWLSPVFPTGGFAYSSGLETAVSSSKVRDQVSLKNWLESLLMFGRLHNDVIYLKSALHCWDDAFALREINDLSKSAAGSRELHFETIAQGRAFVDGLNGWETSTEISFPTDPALPVAVGAACGWAKISPQAAITTFTHAFIANQLQIAIRLSVIGQAGAAETLAHLERKIVELAERVETLTLDDLGNTSFVADIVSMQHETMDGRLFRS